jgi:hypothetical protein
MSAVLRVNHAPLMTAESITRRHLIYEFKLPQKNGPVHGKMYNQDSFLVIEFAGHIDTVSVEASLLSYTSKTVNDILNAALRKLLEEERKLL